MRKSWKEKIDRQPNIERLTQIIEDKIIDMENIKINSEKIG